jgi:hypothetical protein
MSFDLELMAFKDGGPAMFPSRIVNEALAPFIQSRDDEMCLLAFPDGGGGEMPADNDEEMETSGVSIGGASGTDIYSALYEILRQTNSVLFWSFGGCVVADASVISDLPDGFTDDLGEPIVVGGGAEIAAAVAKT